ncbi:TetR/AcrR family transcriptional regulator [Gordonia sp. C13]|uniref:TetR/AcrR family transcriptional regulator n=1 Tax=Gordonia sp. C13 TaxID=2935078 RepID=UPI00200B780E|nr:TetR/AcrR family transcriptional regulator [Gordonia sp. C13]MCK8612454.1 TetR/AcrR family transcriptional regulator [Gordonia sp. C13]
MPRADAQRNVDALLAAAKEEFAAHGVDVSVRSIAARAGVGTATLYRHFPLRSDLVAAVFRHELDECVAAAGPLAEQYAPGEALERWVQRYREFLQTKRGLASALHSGDPAYSSLPEYFHSHAAPALGALLGKAANSGEIRADVAVAPLDLLGAIANLCVPFPGSDNDTATRLVALLLDGLRYRP